MRKTYITPDLKAIQVEPALIIAYSALNADGDRLYMTEREYRNASDAASCSMDDWDWE